MTAANLDRCHEDVHGNRRIDPHLAAIDEFRAGERSLSANALEEHLTELARAFAFDNKGTPTVTPCYPTAKIALDSLRGLLNDASMLAMLDSSGLAPKVGPALRNALTAVCSEYVKKLELLARDNDEIIKEGLTRLFRMFEDAWYRHGEGARHLIIDAVTTLTRFYSNDLVRNEFPAFSDTVVATLAAVHAGSGQATDANRALLSEFLRFWRQLMETNRRNPQLLSFLRKTLCFRCCGIARVMRLFSMERISDAVPTFIDLMSSLATNKHSDDLAIELQSTRDHRHELDTADAELALWYKSVQSPAVRSMRERLRPLFQMQSRRGARSDIHMSSAELHVPGGSETFGNAQLLDADRTATVVRGTITAEACKRIQDLGLKSIDLTMHLPAGYSLPPSQGKVEGTLKKVLASRQAEDPGKRDIVVELDHDWVTRMTAWRDFVAYPPNA